MNNSLELSEKKFARLLEAQSPDLSIGEIVFSERMVSRNELLVDRGPDGELLTEYLFRCIRGEKKKIIILGEPGVGKSSLTIFIRNLAERYTFLHYIDVHKVEYALKEEILASHVLLGLIHFYFGSMEKSKREKVDEKKSGYISYFTHITKFSDSLQKEGLKLALLNQPSETLSEICPSFAKLNDEEKKKELDTPNGRRKVLIEVYKKIIDKMQSKEHIILILDDFHLLMENTESFALMNDLIDNTRIIGVILMPIKKFESDQLGNIISKDSFIQRVNGLALDDCVSIMRTRLLISRGINPNRPINWIADVIPFEKAALDSAALSAKGNPLEFIRLCAESYHNMCEEHVKTISKSLMNQTIETYRQKEEQQFMLKVLPSLSEKETEIYMVIQKNKEGFTAEGVAEIVYGSKEKRINAVVHLLNMLKKGVIIQERRGRYVYFLVKG
ncbi:AAA ATPase domain protein [uncultured archaeon]|nr:AAA ATPase domain protein [uncultured archaeon]